MNKTWQPRCRDCRLDMVYNPEETRVTFDFSGNCGCVGAWECTNCGVKVHDYEIAPAHRIKPRYADEMVG